MAELSSFPLLVGTEDVNHARLLRTVVGETRDLLRRSRREVGISDTEADLLEHPVPETIVQADGKRLRVDEFPGSAETDPPDSPFAGDAVIAALASLEERYAKRRFPSAISGAVESLRQLFNDGPILQTDARSVMEPARQLLNWLSQEQIRINGGMPDGAIPPGMPYVFDVISLGNGKELRLSTCQFCAVRGGAAFSCPKAYPPLPLEWVEKLRKRLMELKLIAADDSPWYVGNQATPDAICWCSHNGAPKKECAKIGRLKPSPRKRGRPAKASRSDEEIVHMWDSGEYRTKKDLAGAIGRDFKDVKNAIERRRGRRRRAAD